jgi:hypothetical protein
MRWILVISTLLALTRALCIPSQAAVLLYDWDISVDVGPGACGLGPACFTFVGGSLNESGTFTVNGTKDLLGTSGVLSPTGTPNYSLVISSITSVTPASSQFWQVATLGVATVLVDEGPGFCFNPDGTGGICPGPDVYGNYVVSTGIDYSLASVEPVPEPSTWAMLLIGFTAIGFAGYRKSQRKKFHGLIGTIERAAVNPAVAQLKPMLVEPEELMLEPANMVDPPNT